MKSSRFRHLSARRWGQQALKSEFTEFGLGHPSGIAPVALHFRNPDVPAQLAQPCPYMAAKGNMINEGQSAAVSPCAAGGLIGHKSSRYIIQWGRGERGTGCGGRQGGPWILAMGNAMNWELGAARRGVCVLITQGWGTVAFAFPSWNMQWLVLPSPGQA